jgi:hypothetical protein
MWATGSPAVCATGRAATDEGDAAALAPAQASVAASEKAVCLSLTLRGLGVAMLLISFGGRAAYGRPLALRTRLATGVPLSGTAALGRKAGESGLH